MPQRSKRSIKFNDKNIKTIDVPSGREEWHDAETPGLILRVSPTSRVWYFLGRVDGRLNRRKLGDYRKVSVTIARKLAREILGDIATGKYISRSVKKGEPTLNDLWLWFNENHSMVKKSPLAHKKDILTYNNHLSKFGHIALHKITREQMEKMLADGTEQNGEFAAALSIKLLNFMWKKALDPNSIKVKPLGQIPLLCPAMNISLPRPNVRTRFLSSDELTRWFEAIKSVKSKMHQDALIVSLLTAARKDNVITMRREELDLNAKLWIVPKEKSKNKHLLVIPLGEEVLAILERRIAENESNPKTAGSPWVFPSTNKKSTTGHICDLFNAMKKSRLAAKIEDLHVHDLRRTLASWQAINNTSLQIIGQTLGHRSSKSTEVYAHLVVDPVRDSMATATRAILKNMRPKEGQGVDTGHEQNTQEQAG